MGFLGNLFGARTPEARRPVVRSSRIESPSIGFLNLQGPSGAALMEADRTVLSPLFKESKTSSDVVPKCNVLFLYCTFDPQGNVAGSSRRVRDLVKDAGASIAVVAFENTSAAYSRVLRPGNDWRANIVLVLDRKGDKCARFFERLFRAMFAGQSMLMAWVALAPQIPGYDPPDNPSAFMVPDAGHIAFGQPATISRRE